MFERSCLLDVKKMMVDTSLLMLDSCKFEFQDCRESSVPKHLHVTVFVESIIHQTVFTEKFSAAIITQIEKHLLSLALTHSLVDVAPHMVQQPKQNFQYHFQMFLTKIDL